MDFRQLVRERHSIRKYTNQQIRKEDLTVILEAGVYAPNAGSGQRSMLVAIHNKELTTRIGQLNVTQPDRTKLIGSFVSKEQPSTIDDPTKKNGFYDAPCAVAIFAQDKFVFQTADAYCCAANMVLQATELGLASCIISRGKETFLSEEGKEIMDRWNIPENYSCVCFVILGYIDGEQPVTKPRRPGRIQIVE